MYFFEVVWCFTLHPQIGIVGTKSRTKIVPLMIKIGDYILCEVNQPQLRDRNTCPLLVLNNPITDVNALRLFVILHFVSAIISLSSCTIRSDMNYLVVVDVSTYYEI